MMELARAFGPRLLRSEPLARHCSLGVGGPADFFVVATTRAELELAVALAGAGDVPLLVLGSGANVLPADAGFRGLVVRNVARSAAYSLDGPLVTADSGTSLPVLARRLARQGLGGLEWGTGIPGTVGGATVNNAGAHGGWVAQALHEVHTVDGKGVVRRRGVGELAYGYRQSALKSVEGRPAPLAEIVLGATFRVASEDPKELLRRIDQWARERALRQPLRSASAGSFFRNPPGDFAGRLIETAGLKGARVGGAQVSPMHANFVINSGGASARQVLDLAREVAEAVQARAGVTLEMEVELVGAWDGC